MKKKIVILSSGRGSGFKALVRAHREGVFEAELLGLFCDQPDAPVIERAKKLGVRFSVVSNEFDSLSRSAFDQKCMEQIEKELGRPDVWVLSGYMRILSREWIESTRTPLGITRIVNIHPSLLPAFAGLHGYEQAFDYGCQVAGCTVHLVEPKVDSGPILAQESFSIAGFHDAPLVEARGLGVEHGLYARTLNWFLKDQFQVVESKGRLRVVPN